MGIYQPEIILTKEQKKLLLLLKNLLSENLEGTGLGHNLPEGEITLTKAEAEGLVKILENLLENKLFLENVFFSEEITKIQTNKIENLREVYLSRRKILGRSRAASTMQWAAFLSRLGPNFKPYPYRTSATLEFDYFCEMERRLFLELDFPPKLADLLVKEIAEKEKAISDIRFQGKELKRGTFNSFFKNSIRSIKSFSKKDLFKTSLSLKDTKALIIICSNMAVLFTTRDWSVAGVISMWVGYLSKG